MKWGMYNDSLVRRVRFCWISRFLIVGTGRPFTYPDSLIRLLASIRLLFHMPYRQLEGFTRGLSKYVEGLRAPDYTTLDRRINGLRLNVDEALVSSDEPVYVALNSTGVKVHKSGDWMRKRFT